MAEKVLSVKDLVINFKTDNGIVHAVRNVSFDLNRGETLCIVGESGSGKSVTSKAIMGILANNSIVENGSIMYRGENLLEVSEEEFHKIRGHKIGMIFQDPLSSLNPIVRIGKQITEATLINSNKLKIMFNDIISDDLVAFENTVAKMKIKIDFLRKKQDEFIFSQKAALNNYKDQKEKILGSIKFFEKALAVELNENKKANFVEQIKQEKDKLQKLKPLTKEEVSAIKKSIVEKKKQTKDEIAKTKADTAIIAKPLKEKLNETKKEAAIKVAEYKEQVLREHDEQIQALKAKLPTSKSEKETKEIKNKIKEVELETINKLKITKAEAKRRAIEIMHEVGIPYPERRFRQYPFEFSGGMRQRIVIAIALTATPEILICDEPTTALDVTIQAQILELINRIKSERDLSVIFITHDLGVVANMADRVAVMYAGKIVEYGTADELFFDPRHPYTWALLSSIPDVDSKERLEAIPGTPPNMIYPPKGDAFAIRSRYAMNIDFKEEPPYFKISDSHYAATWLLDERAPKVEMPKIVTERIKNALKAGEENAK